MDHQTPKSIQQGNQPPLSVLKDHKALLNTISRVVKYLGLRAFVLLTAVMVGVFLTITIANRQLIITSETKGNLLKGWISGVQQPTRTKYGASSQEIEQALYGSVDTVLGRNLILLYKGLTFNLGESERLFFYSGGELLGDVNEIILDSLPRTLLLFGTANFLLFFTTIFIALSLSRKLGGWLNRLLRTLSPISSVPSWLYGMVLTVIFARVFHFFAGGIWDTWPAELRIEHVPIVLKSLFLPVLAIFISKFFQSIYTWRKYFQINSEEDYVEFARSKGLPSKIIMRSYILRPTLPGIVTSFVLIIILIWQEAIIIELFFGVAGIGHLFYNALAYSDMPLIVGMTVTFAFLLAGSIFLLDFIYVLVDPRVKVGSEGRIVRAASTVRKRFLFFPLRKRKKTQVSSPQPGSPTKGRPDLPGVFSGLWKNFGSLIRQIWHAFRSILHHRPAVIGLGLIFVLILISVYAIFAVPYSEAISLWRGDGGVWDRNPRKAQPAWVNFFRFNKLPSTITLSSKDGTAIKEISRASVGMNEIIISFPLDYPYDGFPQDIVLYLDPKYDEKRPFITLTWFTPDGREIELGNISLLMNQEKFSIVVDEKIARKFSEQKPMQGMFADTQGEGQDALRGTYKLQLSAVTFEEDSNLDAELVLYGQVYGLAGTDDHGRDLTIALLWGTPVALAFGLLAAIGISFSTMIIAAIGAWHGGWLDRSIQWITDVNMVLPVFVVLLLVFNYYSMRLWTILAVTILLSIFGASIKTYRSIFLQVKEAPYVEAARAYGASNFRIINRYLVPRIISVLIPQLIILVPTFVFLETTLAYLGMSDPLLPTWGKVIREALAGGGLTGHYYWLLEPFFLLILTGFAFLTLGYSLERIFDPRLRDR